MDNRSSALRGLLDTFHKYSRDPRLAVENWKKTHNGKVVGCIGLDVPEPLIHASGMLPVVILDRDEEVTLGNAHVEMHMCGYIRSVVDQAMKGQLSYCDEILAHDCCHIVRMIGDAMHTFCDGVKKLQFVYFSPLLEDGDGQEYTREEMALLRGKLEDISGNRISDEALRSSIALYNRHKALLCRVYDIRRARPGILRGVEVSDIVASGMCMPKEEHIPLLEKLIEELESAQAPAADGVPVVVHGSLCERCDDFVLECIESCGGVIVDDDLYVGARYFNTFYDESIEPMESLLKAYVKRSAPCPTRYEERNLGDYLSGVMERAKAQAVIAVVVKFCEAHDFAYFTAYQRFRKLGVKHMLVETEHGSTPEGQLKTRLQGFFESIRMEG